VLSDQDIRSAVAGDLCKGPHIGSPPSGLTSLGAAHVLLGARAFLARRARTSADAQRDGPVERLKSGCVSSEGWHVQQEVDLPGQESGAP